MNKDHNDQLLNKEVPSLCHNKWELPNNMFLNKNSPVNTSDNLDDRKYAYEKCL